MDLLGAFVLERILIHSVDGLLGASGYYFIRFGQPRLKALGWLIIVIYLMSLVGMFIASEEKTTQFDYWGPATALLWIFVVHVIVTWRRSKSNKSSRLDEAQGNSVDAVHHEENRI